MANTIKKISAFDRIPSNAITGNEEFIIAKDHANYKIDLFTLYRALDAYMMNNQSNVTDWVAKNFATNEAVENVISKLAPQADFDSLVNKYNNLANNLNNYATKDWTEIILDNYVSKPELAEEHDSFAHKDHVYQKSEVYTKEEAELAITTHDNAVIKELTTTIDSKIDNVQSQLDDILKQLNTAEFNVVKTDGDGHKFLADDGNYYPFSKYTLYDSGEIEITNDNIDNNFIWSAHLNIPAFPQKHILHVDIYLGSSTMHKTQLKSITIDDPEVLGLIKKTFTTSISSCSITFENEISQFEANGETKNLIVKRSYVNGDQNTSKVSVKPAIIDILHGERHIPISLQLTRDISTDNIIAPKIQWYLLEFK